jgi:hypothetical protein
MIISIVWTSCHYLYICSLDVYVLNTYSIYWGTFPYTPRRSKIIGSSKFNPFLFIKNKRLSISSEGFSVLEVKWRGMFSEGNAAHPVGCDSPLQIVHAVWWNFFEFELAGLGLTARAESNGRLERFKFEKSSPTWPLLSAEGRLTLPDHSAE